MLFSQPCSLFGDTELTLLYRYTCENLLSVLKNTNKNLLLCKAINYLTFKLPNNRPTVILTSLVWVLFFVQHRKHAVFPMS